MRSSHTASKSNQGKRLQKAVNVVNCKLRWIESCQATLRKRRMHTGGCLNFNETRCCAAPSNLQSCVFLSRSDEKESAKTAAHTLLNEFLSSALNPIEYVVGVDIVTETRCAPRLQLNEALGSSRGWLFASSSSTPCVIIFVSQRACVWSTSLSQQKHNYHTIQLVAIHRRRTQINRFAIDAEIILFLPLTPLSVALCRVLGCDTIALLHTQQTDDKLCDVTSGNPSLFWLRLCHCFCIHPLYTLHLSVAWIKFTSPFAQQNVFSANDTISFKYKWKLGCNIGLKLIRYNC